MFDFHLLLLLSVFESSVTASLSLICRMELCFQFIFIEFALAFFFFIIIFLFILTVRRSLSLLFSSWSIADVAFIVGEKTFRFLATVVIIVFLVFINVELLCFLCYGDLQEKIFFSFRTVLHVLRAVFDNNYLCERNEGLQSNWKKGLPSSISLTLLLSAMLWWWVGRWLSKT